MSFGFSVGDAIALLRLANDLVSSIGNAPADFADFVGDLSLAQTVLQQLVDGWALFSERTAAAGVERDAAHYGTVRTTISGIRRGLEDLQEQLNRYRDVGAGVSHGLANLRFSRKLRRLRERLQLHMASLQLILQSINLMQGNRIGEALQAIREAQEGGEGGQADSDGDDPEQEYEESLDAFTVRYNPRRAGSSTVSRTETSSQGLIRRWQQEVQRLATVRSGLPSINEAPIAGTELGNPAPKSGKISRGLVVMCNTTSIALWITSLFLSAYVLYNAVNQDPFWAATFYGTSFGLISVPVILVCIEGVIPAVAYTVVAFRRIPRDRAKYFFLTARTLLCLIGIAFGVTILSVTPDGADACTECVTDANKEHFDLGANIFLAFGIIQETLACAVMAVYILKIKAVSQWLEQF